MTHFIRLLIVRLFSLTLVGMAALACQKPEPITAGPDLAQTVLIGDDKLYAYDALTGVKSGSLMLTLIFSPAPPC